MLKLKTDIGISDLIFILAKWVLKSLHSFYSYYLSVNTEEFFNYWFIQNSGMVFFFLKKLVKYFY